MSVCKHEAWEQRDGYRICADCRAYLGAVARAPKPPRRTPLYWVVRIAGSYYGGRALRWAFHRSNARRFHHRASAVVVADQVSGRVVAVVPRRSKPSADVAALVAAARAVVADARRFNATHGRHSCVSCAAWLPKHGPHCPIGALAAALGEA